MLGSFKSKSLERTKLSCERPKSKHTPEDCHVTVIDLLQSVLLCAVKIDVMIFQTPYYVTRYGDYLPLCKGKCSVSLLLQSSLLGIHARVQRPSATWHAVRRRSFSLFRLAL